MHIILRNCILPALLTIFCTGQCLASSIQCDVLRGDKKHNRIKMAFFAEGYTEAERAKYDSDVNRIVDNFFSITPFKEYREMFNVFRVWTPSKHSGIPSDSPDSTYFGGTISGRILNISDISFNTLMNTTIRDTSMFGDLSGMESGSDIPVIVFNCSYSGGSDGRQLIYTSPNPDILPHETAHLLGKLNDEYDSDYLQGREGPNTTSKTDPDSIPWRNWIKKDTPIPTPETEDYSQVIGLFEGASYQSTGWYRPKLRCRMSGIKDPFCEVCREKLTCEMLRRYNFKGKWLQMQVFDSLYPAPDSTVKNVSVFVTLASDSTPFSYSWFFNGKKLDNQSTSLDVETLHDSGTIEFVIKDTMGFIIDTSFLKNFSSCTIRWFYRPASSSIIRKNAVAMNNSIREIKDGLYFVPSADLKDFSIFSLNGRKIPLQKMFTQDKSGSIYDIRNSNAAATYIVKYNSSKGTTKSTVGATR